MVMVAMVMALEHRRFGDHGSKEMTTIVFMRRSKESTNDIRGEDKTYHGTLSDEEIMRRYRLLYPKPNKYQLANAALLEAILNHLRFRSEVFFLEQ